MSKEKKEGYDKETWEPKKSTANDGKKYAPFIEEMIQGFLDGITDQDMSYIHERTTELYTIKLKKVIKDFTNDLVVKCLDFHFNYIKASMERDQLLDKLGSVGITVELDVSNEDVENEIQRQINEVKEKDEH